MLRDIPTILSPDLLKIMQEMGHGDVLVLADANFPAATCAKRLVRQDGIEATALLDAILRFFPLDIYVQKPAALMNPAPQDPTPEIWGQYEKIIKKWDKEEAFSDFELIDRMDFYEYAKNAYAIIQTGTTAKYANICITKGVL